MQSILNGTLGAVIAGTVLASAAGAQAQDDRFASCADPEAARRFVAQCMQANPYNTKEVCEERALAEVCAAKK